MRPIRAGKLRHRVQFQSCSGSQSDSVGQPQQGWQTYHTTYAAIDAFRGQMLYQTNEFISQSTYKVTIRYPGDSVQISAQDRMVCGNDTYVIDAVINTEQRNRQLEIFCHIINEVN